MTAEEMWLSFSGQSEDDSCEYSAWAFGGAPDPLADLVLHGEKTATASAYSLYEIDNEDLPEVGEYSVILDSHDNAVCIIKTTKVYITPFVDVSPDHAFKEGEGDKSLQYWREVHTQFFSECMEEAGLKFTENMPTVCEEFEVVYPLQV